MLFAFAAPIFPLSRSRHSLIPLLVALLSLLAESFQRASYADTVDFRPAVHTGSFRQAKAVIEVEGKLKLNADGQEVKHLPLKVHADLQYGERVLSATRQWSEARLVRAYRTAEAKIRLNESELTSELRPERRLIAVQSNGKDAILYSPDGPLTREELELISTPASGLAPEALLPAKPQKTGDRWSLTEATVARLLGLEAVSQQDVTCTLDSVKDNVAIVSLVGKVTGAVGGVSSDVDLKGKLNFDLKLRAVTWLTVAYKENRAIGHAQPGFDVLTTVRMVFAPAKTIEELSDKALARLSLKAEPSQTLIEFDSEAAGFQIIHDRRWSVMLDRHDLTVMRLIDRGDLIAQCNITPLPSLGKDEQLTLEGFQEDVKRVLGKNFEEIVETSEETSDSGLRLLRVLVAGKAGELPIQWTYYHVSDDHSNRASLVFTIESSLLDRFPTIDREMISNFRFLPGKEPTRAGGE